MPELSRRRNPERHDCWHVYYGGDVHVGSVSRCVGNPNAVERWQWSCGFYPGSHPGESVHGTAPTFEDARAAFEAAWRDYLPKRTDADFQAWREERDWTERKYAMWARGERMPSQKPSSLMTCPCGERFDSHRLEDTMLHVPHIEAATVRAR